MPKSKTKRCTKCKRRKSLKLFNKKGAGVTGRCKKCLGDDYRAAYANKPERRQQVKNAVARYKVQIGEFIVELKRGKPCVDCGNIYPHYVMDFDHCRGKKLMNLSSAVRVCWARDKILAEVAKCDLVCANCHRERTHGRIAHVVERSPDKRENRIQAPMRLPI